MSRRAVRKAALRWVPLLLGLLVVDIALTWLDFAPDHLRLVLVVLLVVVGAATLRASLVDSEPEWRAQDLRPMTVADADRRLGAYVRLLESHLTAGTPDPALRDQLARLCDDRLRRRHGLERDDPAAAELLGAELVRDLAGAPRRLSPATIRHHVERIEDL